MDQDVVARGLPYRKKQTTTVERAITVPNMLVSWRKRPSRDSCCVSHEVVPFESDLTCI